MDGLTALQEFYEIGESGGKFESRFLEDSIIREGLYSFCLPGPGLPSSEAHADAGVSVSGNQSSEDLPMWPSLCHVLRWKMASILVILLPLGACTRSSGRSGAQLTFSTVPPAGTSGSDKLDTIEGHARNAEPGQRIVLYAKSEDRWWVQPSTADPFTTIQGDGNWRNQTHLGAQYAALLVDPTYYPPETRAALPNRGGGVEDVVVVKGQSLESLTQPKTLHFSGYDWIIRSASSYRGGSLNEFDPANAWVDEHGELHLRIAKRKEQFSCAEVQLSRSLGYGTYVFVVRDISHLEASAVLTLFTWDGVGPEENRRELAFEISRWGSHDKDNIAFVIQPYYIPTNVVRFYAPAGVLTNSFRWEPGRVTFTTSSGSHPDAAGNHVNQHVFASGIPAPGGESPRMNLYIFGKGEIPLQHENEIVVERFEYYP